jgi:hypothetical protein
MNVFLKEIGVVWNWVVGNPEGPVEMVVVVLLAPAAALFAMAKLAKAAGGTEYGIGRMALVYVVGIVIVLAAPAALSVYVVPRVESAFLSRWLAPAGAVLGVLLLVVPLQSLLCRMGLLKSLTGVALGAAVSVGIVLLVNAGADSVRNVRTGVGEVKDTREEHRKILDE